MLQTSPTINTITREDALERIGEFREQAAYSNYFKFGGAKAFTMGAEEILNLATMIKSLQTMQPDLGVNAVRFYMATRSQWTMYDQSEIAKQSSTNCLVMVPVKGYVSPETTEIDVNGDGTSELIYLTRPQAGTDIHKVISLDNSDIHLCYDFTFPCPSTCPEVILPLLPGDE